MSESLTFLSQKMSKVRWKPTSSTIQKSECFATGSYEDIQNSVTIWGLSHMTHSANTEMEIESGQPLKQCHCRTSGSVCGMEFADPEIIVVGTSSGNVSLLKLDTNLGALNQHYTWKSLHKFGGSTDVATNLPEIVSVGEDGSIHILRIDSNYPLRTFAQADSCPITSVQYLNSHDLCTTNTVGQLRMWDVRSPSDTPTRIMVSRETLVALRCADHHPTQNHIIATGGHDGCVTIFDVRKECAPVTRLQIHDEDVWEIHFHKTNPSYLFTCSEDGSVRQLNNTFELKTLSLGSASIEVSELLSVLGTSINSLDVNGCAMVCSTDVESVYVMNDVV